MFAWMHAFFVTFTKTVYIKYKIIWANDKYLILKVFVKFQLNMETCRTVHLFNNTYPQHDWRYTVNTLVTKQPWIDNTQLFRSGRSSLVNISMVFHFKILILWVPIKTPARTPLIKYFIPILNLGNMYKLISWCDFQTPTLFLSLLFTFFYSQSVLSFSRSNWCSAYSLLKSICLLIWLHVKN